MTNACSVDPIEVLSSVLRKIKTESWYKVCSPKICLATRAQCEIALRLNGAMPNEAELLRQAIEEKERLKVFGKDPREWCVAIVLKKPLPAGAFVPTEEQGLRIFTIPEWQHNTRLN